MLTDMSRPMRLLLPLAVAVSAFASSATFSGSGIATNDLNQNISYSAVFSMTTVNSQAALMISLMNTSVGVTHSTGAVLTALYFNISGGTVLTPYLAALGPGSAIVQDASTVSNPSPVGNNWQYLEKNAGFAGANASSDNEALSASALSDFSSANFCSSNCQTLGGADYGIVPSSPNYTATNENTALSNTTVVQNTVVFILTGIASSFNPFTGVTNVVGQFGTTSSSPQVIDALVVTPEPATFGLAGLVVALAIWRKRNA